MVLPEPVLPMSFLLSSSRAGKLLSQEGGAEGDFAGCYACAVLKAAKVKVGPVEVHKLWSQSGVRWQDLLAEGKSAEEFVKANVSLEGMFET